MACLIAALLVRAKTLGVMDGHTYAQAWKALSVRGWRKVEPGSLGAPEAPVLLNRAVGLVETTGLSFVEFVGRAGLSEADVRTLPNRGTGVQANALGWSCSKTPRFSSVYAKGGRPVDENNLQAPDVMALDLPVAQCEVPAAQQQAEQC